MLGGGSPAVMRNISALGLYVTTPPTAQLERWLLLGYELPDAGLRFKAVGEVMRIESFGDVNGIAIRLHSPALQPLS